MFTLLRPTALFLGLACVASSLSAAYQPPSAQKKESELKIFHEPEAPLSEQLAAQISQAASAFSDLQGHSAIDALLSDAGSLATAAEMIEQSLQPLLTDSSIDVKARLRDAIRAKAGTGFGYGGMTFPEVHVWRKSTLREIFGRGDHPPGLTLDPESQTLNQEFVRADGKLNPITVIVDDSLSAEERLAHTGEFLRYWIETVRRGQDSVVSVLIFTAVRDVSRDLLATNSKLPVWFQLGTANLIAYNDCAKLLGDAAADHAMNLSIGPQSLPRVSAVLDAEIDPSRADGADKTKERASFEICRAAQNNTSKAFVRLVLNAAAKVPDRSQNNAQIIALYRTAAVSGKNLFDT